MFCRCTWPLTVIIGSFSLSCKGGILPTCSPAPLKRSIRLARSEAISVCSLPRINLFPTLSGWPILTTTVINNLFHFAFVMLFVRSFFAWAEVIIILNFINLSSLYFRHPGYARFIHQPVVSGPLAWTFVAIYWNGAIMVPNSTSLVARIFGNIFIWSILVYGLFFIVVYKVRISPQRIVLGNMLTRRAGLHHRIQP